MSSRDGREIESHKNTPLDPYLFIGGVLGAKNWFHYREHSPKAENEIRFQSDPLVWPQKGYFQLPPLMFWACPVRTSASEGQLQRVQNQPVSEAVRWRQQPPLFQTQDGKRGRKSDKNFEGFPKVAHIDLWNMNKMFLEEWKTSENERRSNSKWNIFRYFLKCQIQSCQRVWSHPYLSKSQVLTHGGTFQAWMEVFRTLWVFPSCGLAKVVWYGHCSLLGAAGPDTLTPFSLHGMVNAGQEH